MRVLERIVRLDWRECVIFESSPSGPASRKIAQECERYIASQFFEGVPSGASVDGIRCEDLRSLSLPDESVDLVITQDVFEHVVDPAGAFKEIERVLRPGGAHVFTVPIHDRPTVVRVADDGAMLMAADYHQSPVGDGRSLVVREWGPDLLGFISQVTSMTTSSYDETSWKYGLRGQMKHVLVSRKRASSGQSGMQP